MTQLRQRMSEDMQVRNFALNTQLRICNRCRCSPAILASRRTCSGASCALKPRCTPDKHKRLKRWQHEGVLDKMQDRLDRMPDAMTIRRQTVEHPFGTLKAWMGSTHFLTKTLEQVRTEMSLQVLAYNMKRMINIFGVKPLMTAIAA
ncbi:hypothetical protein BQ8794_240020 [Mesorhizobium prunaredense]|uniref:Transposase DDE domain-containing protein n=2 Tax=Mesorhizobium TaxID=68287 RepID=A0A1R3V7G6_9HYPH|nr:Tnp_DDE_dom domain-containing protein [Mesorhizobium ventifaucium]SIT55813.1 hypothetical protein BQ8794_240020 [Mesorhizobium prunaredense]